jgi:ketosteroid isomerase-like protein
MEPSPELRSIIAGWFAAVANGDATWVDRYVSRQAGVRLVCTDPSEWLAAEQVAEMLRAEALAMGGQVKVTLDATEAFCEGTVGWGVARPTITLPNGRDFTPRWSAVFHQEGGEWKLVQLHASVGVPNEDLLGAPTPD